LPVASSRTVREGVALSTTFVIFFAHGKVLGIDGTGS
jgi:hypothetical protein